VESELLAAILGGSVGVLLGALARALGIPSDVRAHDAAVADRDEALSTWVADREQALRRECSAFREAVGPPPGVKPTPLTPEHSFWEQASADFDQAAAEADPTIAEARGIALLQYREEGRRARLDVSAILAAEGWGRRAYRKVTGQTAPILTTPQRAAPMLDAWRKPSMISGKRPVWPDDATKRTLEDAIASLPVTGP